MGYAENVRHIWKMRESSDINPGFVSILVAVTMVQMKQEFALQLQFPENQTEARQEFIHGLEAAMPEAQRILTDAMELAVLGRHCPQELSMSAAPERFLLPKDPVELRRRIGAMREIVQGQFAMLALPEVADDIRNGVRDTYAASVFDTLSKRICEVSLEEFGFANSKIHPSAARF